MQYPFSCLRSSYNAEKCTRSEGDELGDTDHSSLLPLSGEAIEQESEPTKFSSRDTHQRIKNDTSSSGRSSRGTEAYRSTQTEDCKQWTTGEALISYTRQKPWRNQSPYTPKF
ncbi:hypothetical protein SAY87_005633 [Trapa incisa]|uniref:Uncharacterized protein n=1 Tax=Trapa incisa TaxID=236973 RepID=A0AAN7K535_9MYRT|nr:hypothetical protein SAY87_005633 [Trapa incisa]